jgi:hypothetical protein
MSVIGQLTEDVGSIPTTAPIYGCVVQRQNGGNLALPDQTMERNLELMID